MRAQMIGLLIVGLVGSIPTAARAQDVARAPAVVVKPKELEPCCSVVAINMSDSLVSAREIATGYTFKFKLTDKRLLTTAKVGDKVWADFSSKSVRLRKADAAPCCAIVAQVGPARGGKP
jgi:hypothetical protein